MAIMPCKEGFLVEALGLGSGIHVKCRSRLSDRCPVSRLGFCPKRRRCLRCGQRLEHEVTEGCAKYEKGYGKPKAAIVRTLEDESASGLRAGPQKPGEYRVTYFVFDAAVADSARIWHVF